LAAGVRRTVEAASREAITALVVTRVEVEALT
jgi:hypothetical protein